MSVLEVQERSGGKAAKLREKGIVPMALIMHGSETKLIQAPLSDLRKVIQQSSGAGSFELKVKGDSKKHTVVIKQVDTAIVGKKLLHVSVMAINKDEVLVMDASIVGVGIPGPVKAQEGVLGNPTSSVKLKGKIADLPGQVEVDVSELQLHESITAGQLELPANVELASSPDAVLFSLHPLRHVREEGEAAEAPTEPEVVGASESEADSSSE